MTVRKRRITVRGVGLDIDEGESAGADDVAPVSVSCPPPTPAGGDDDDAPPPPSISGPRSRALPRRETSRGIAPPALDTKIEVRRSTKPPRA